MYGSLNLCILCCGSGVRYVEVAVATQYLPPLVWHWDETLATSEKNIGVAFETGSRMFT